MSNTITPFRQQLRNNLVGLLSLLVALSALGYSTWRNERTEENRSVRIAAFEMLKSLGELQQIVDYAHFRHDTQKGDLTQGWGRVLQVRDLAMLMPAPIQQSSEHLLAAWRDHAEKMASSNESAQAVSEQILLSRQDVLAALAALK